MKCSSCGNEITPGSKFCRVCGAIAPIAGSMCPSCGVPVSEGVEFCGNCGSKLPVEPPKESPQPTPETKPNSVDNICLSCGTRLSHDKKFCNVCGTPVGAERNIVPQQTSNNANSKQPTVASDSQIIGRAAAHAMDPAPKKKTGLIVTLIIVISLIVAAGGVVVYCYFNNLWFFAPSTSSAVSSTQEPENSMPVAIEPQNAVTPVDDNVIRNIIANNSSYTTYGVYVYNLTNGYEYGYNHHRSFLSSAMGQVVILETASQIIDMYDIDINNDSIRFDYLANGKEAPNSKNENGRYLPIKKYIEDVAVYGDNNKSNHLVDYIYTFGNAYDYNGFDVINRMQTTNGYSNTHINRKIFTDPRLVDESVPANSTTPYDIAHIFERLINNSSFGNKSYMMNIFCSVGYKGEPIGLKKYIPAYYSSCSANALTNQVTNDVAIISDGNTEIVVAIFCNTDENKTNVENNPQREKVQALILEHILDTQFGQQ